MNTPYNQKQKQDIAKEIDGLKKLAIFMRILMYLVAAYIIVWIAVMPSYGTIRCKNWNKEQKCDEITIGPIDFGYRFTWHDRK